MSLTSEARPAGAAPIRHAAAHSLAMAGCTLAGQVCASLTRIVVSQRRHDEPTVFGNVGNGSVIAQEEIFGPVLSVIPARDEADAVRIANDTIYGLNSAVYTADVERARAVAGQIRAGTVGHNGFKSDATIGFGGFKQSGIGREGGLQGLQPFLEAKAVLLDGPTARYERSDS